MTIKASVHGPNRRKNRPGDSTVASDLTSTSSHCTTTADHENKDIYFRIKSLDRLLYNNEENDDYDDDNDDDDDDVDGAYTSEARRIAKSMIGENESSSSSSSAATAPCCLFSLDSFKRGKRGDDGGGLSLLHEHAWQVERERGEKKSKESVETLIRQCGMGSDDPILIHFHDIPIFVLRAVPLSLPLSSSSSSSNQASSTTTTNYTSGMDRFSDKNMMHDFLYLSDVQCHNHKVCEDTVMKIKCCSRPIQSAPKDKISSSFSAKNYDLLSAVGVEVHPRGGTVDINTNGNYSKSDADMSGEDKLASDESDTDYQHHKQQQPISWSFNATDISRRLMNQTYRSILTVNESVVISLPGNVGEGNKELVCRISEVRTQQQDDSGGSNSLTSAEATMDEPYRGRIDLGTELYIFPSDPKSLRVQGGRRLPEGKLPDDVVHITTSDMEWFPVRRVLLAPCIKLTKYVQAGRGKYKNDIPTLPNDERSEDAPTDDGCPHCKVPIDCCTFDRVLLFITSLLYPDEHNFALDLTEVNALSAAADALGLQALDDLCQSQTSTFESRVIKDRYIRLAEVKARNDHGELLILLDGMVLDISRWIDEHPGGPSIIPTQALNIDCTIFFEMYHVSRQAFLYLKSFYIGELSPEDAVKLRSSAEGVEASEGFLQSLRSYTDEWRVSIEEKAGEKVHKSF